MTLHSADGLLFALARSAALTVALSLTISHPAWAAEDPAPAGQAMSPLPTATHGEFDDSCTMGLAEGQTVKTDCSVNWTGDDGKVYCFSSEKSKEAFLKSPADNLKKARDFVASRQAVAAAGAKDFTEEDVNKRVDEGGRRALEGRRLRVPRPQARCRPQSGVRQDQGRARHVGLWLVRQCHLQRQGRAQEAIRHRLLVQARRRRAHADGHSRAEGPEARRR